jgi:ABC-type multidrug transport system permease subunit
MLKVKHVPEQLLDVTITPVMFVVMFTYLFGGAIAGSTGEYLHYILPGILVMSVLFTTVYSGVNPISVLATASRGLMHGGAQTSDILIVLAVAAGLTAAFAPLTTRLYRRG